MSRAKREVKLNCVMCLPYPEVSVHSTSAKNYIIFFLLHSTRLSPITSSVALKRPSDLLAVLQSTGLIPFLQLSLKSSY